MMRWSLQKQKISALFDPIFNFVRQRDLFYVGKPVNWVIEHVGFSITKNLHDMSSIVVMTHRGIRHSIVHFGSLNTFCNNQKLNLPHKSNTIIVSWFHVVPGDQRLTLIPEAMKHVDVWHTACTMTKEALITLGIPPEKIVLIPLGVNLDVFYKPTRDQKEAIRSKLGIPKDKIVIGSFQKDGIGWGEGLEPKLIKGPDVFCDVVEQLSKEYEVFILLTGPTRGYVKKRLEQAGIPYLHHFLDHPDDVAEYYRVLDVYLVTSRIEGGPKAVLESLASGVPLVSTRVGVASDLIKDSENGLLCEVENTDEIVRKSIAVLRDPVKKEKIIVNGLATVSQYDWSQIAQQYQRYLYQRVL